MLIIHALKDMGRSVGVSSYMVTYEMCAANEKVCFVLFCFVLFCFVLLW